MKKVVKNLCVSLFLIVLSGYTLAEGWQIRQVKIDHIQAGNGENFYLSFNAETKGPSECAATWGADWAIIPLTNISERKKYMISLAMSAQASGMLVDVGGTKGDCHSSNGNLPEITYIRVGDYTK